MGPQVEGGRNAYLTDLGSVEGVAEELPAVRPVHRAELDRRYVTLGPADVDIGHAGRQSEGSSLHMALGEVRVGAPVQVAGRQVSDRQGRALVPLAKKCHLPDRPLSGTVFAVMARTRAQTPPNYLVGVKVDRWEVPLVEVVLPADENEARRTAASDDDL